MASEVKRITVRTAKGYDVFIGKGILSNIGRMLCDTFGNRRFCIITDDNVAGLYLGRTESAIKDAGLEVCHFVFGHGEGCKTMESAQAILSFLADMHFTRSDVLIALGGGITGDITGFAAAIYQRGIEFVQIPTTLLAAVDSSVGGKTGVNLGGLKNQIGAFWQPSLVVCDTQTLETLPMIEYASGMAEVIKYGAICRKELCDMIETGADIADIISECVSIKRDIVETDERDTAQRQLLNLGHTFGHAVEKVTKNAFTHGQAVAIGTVMAFKAAQRLGFCQASELGILKRLLSRFSLPANSGCSACELFDAMKNDKKRMGDTVTLVLPRSFGECMLYKVTMDELFRLLEKVTEKDVFEEG